MESGLVKLKLLALAALLAPFIYTGPVTFFLFVLLFLVPGILLSYRFDGLELPDRFLVAFPLSHAVIFLLNTTTLVWRPRRRMKHFPEARGWSSCPIWFAGMI